MDNLSERAMLATLEISSWSGRCVDKEISKTVVEQHAADKDAGRFSKRLINKDHLKEISSICNEARKVFKEKTLAWDNRKSRLLPSTLFSELAETLSELQDMHATTVKSFLENYDEYIDEAREDLNGMFNPDDYPDSNELAEKFGFNYAFEPLSDPKDFRCSIDQSLKEKIQEDMKQRTEVKYNTAIGRLWAQVGKVIETFNAKLADKDAKFKNSLLNNVKDLVDLLPSLNVMGDEKLAEVAERIKNEICTFEVEELRHDQNTRQRAVKNSQEILDTIGEIYG